MRLRGLAERAIRTLTETVDDNFITVAEGHDKSQPSGCLLDDALKAYEKHKANINKKINAQDRAAIAKALESVDVKEAAKNFAKFSKGLGYVGPAMDIIDVLIELRKAVREDSWRSFFVKVEAIAISFSATQLAALAFASLLGAPVGLLGYALIMAGIGALVSDDVVEAANKIIGI